MLTHLDLFSGIGGFTLAAERAGFRTVAHCEIDRFARRVLAFRWPEILCFEDIRTLTADALGRIGLITAGFPCQDLSVAGKRAGLAGGRSGLFWQVVRLAEALRPAWVVLENVPGLLSSAQGRDFRLVIGALADLGYLGTWRVLDAQWFGVAQRRRRVFVVGCLGAERLAALLPFLESGQRHPAPRRQARESVAPCLEAGANRTGGDRPPGTTVDTASSLLVAGTLPASGAGRSRPAGRGNDLDFVVAPAQRGSNHYGDHESAEGHLVTSLQSVDRGLKGQNGSGIGEDLCFTLESSSRHGVSVPAPVAAKGGNRTSGTLEVATACNAKGGTGRNDFESETFAVSGCPTPKIGKNLNGTLRAEREGYLSLGPVASVIRRLTPTEAERLQAFSQRDPLTGEWNDGHTCLCGKNRGRSYSETGETCICPDGPRYRALGNAIAVTCGEWVLARVADAESLMT